MQHISITRINILFNYHPRLYKVCLVLEDLNNVNKILLDITILFLLIVINYFCNFDIIIIVIITT